mgnify:CR=1 FL=1
MTEYRGEPELSDLEFNLLKAACGKCPIFNRCHHGEWGLCNMGKLATEGHDRALGRRA